MVIQSNSYSSQKRKIPEHGSNQTRSSSSTKPAYVNLEFHEVTKRQAAGKGRTRQKLDPNEVRAGARLHPLNNVTHNTENSNNGPDVSDGGLKPRQLSLVDEECPETVSRGTSPIPSPLLRRDSNTSSAPSSDSVFRPISLSDCPHEEMVLNVPLQVETNDPEHESNSVNDGVDSQSGSKAGEDYEVIDDEEDEGLEYTENMPGLVNGDKRFYAMGAYEKQDEEEVNLRENAEVEVLREDDGGWWLVRTSSHSVGWAPSNFLEKVHSLRKTADSVRELPDETDFLEVIPIRPPKSPRVRKMARDMCVEKDFWHYIQKGKDSDTCPLDETEITPDLSPSEKDTGNYQPLSETKATDVEVMAFTFDDYECDPNTGVCLRRSCKTEGIKYVPKNNAPTKDSPKDILEVNNNVIERSESVPSLAESEDSDDLDDRDYEEIE